MEAGIAPNVASSDLTMTGYYFNYGCIDPFHYQNNSTSTETEEAAKSSIYNGSKDLNTIGRDPCLQMGYKWQSPTRDIIFWLCSPGTIFYNGTTVTKTADDYFPVDENGNRVINVQNGWSTYAPTDGRANSTPVNGLWVGVSTKPNGNTKYNKIALFLPCGGYRGRNGTGIGGPFSGFYWSSQPHGGNGQYLYFDSSISESTTNARDRQNAFNIRCCIPDYK